MRRRSERKKSIDISSPAPTSRRTSRRKKSTSEDIPSNVEIPEDIIDQNQGDACSNSKKNEMAKAQDVRNDDNDFKNVSASLPKDKKCTAVIDTIKEEESATYDIIKFSKETSNEGSSNSLDLQPAELGEMVDQTYIKLSLDKLVAIEDKLNDNKTESNGNDSGNKNFVMEIECNEYMNASSDEKLESEGKILSEKKVILSNALETSKVRKRKWISKKKIDTIFPILSISTDSLKNLISDVQPVPLSDIKLDSSSDVEEVLTEKYGEISTEDEKLCSSKDNEHVNKMIIQRRNSYKETIGILACISLRSPSPSKNDSSTVLYITNLVRPFTVLQLKGLLARTGKIMENGFWIDRIKSKCFVQYETEDEAVETRHALHGIRWPTSNPKCLNVDFGKKEAMHIAMLSTQDENKKVGQDSIKENCGTPFYKDEVKIKHVREWDVGKHNDSDISKMKDRQKKKSDNQADPYVKDRDTKRINRKRAQGNELLSNSLSPARKQKDNDPPIRLLDDLFRKTQTTPCIYWLPLTPEQIAEKEKMRKTRLDEQQRRMLHRDLEREKFYDRENERNRIKTREREKDLRRDRSIDRRKSRSRDNRRRY